VTERLIDSPSDELAGRIRVLRDDDAAVALAFALDVEDASQAEVEQWSQAADRLARGRQDDDRRRTVAAVTAVDRLVRQVRRTDGPARWSWVLSAPAGGPPLRSAGFVVERANRRLMLAFQQTRRDAPATARDRRGVLGAGTG
jgi:hypothetical protein